MPFQINEKDENDSGGAWPPVNFFFLKYDMAHRLIFPRASTASTIVHVCNLALVAIRLTATKVLLQNGSGDRQGEGNNGDDWIPRSGDRRRRG